jgi:hypothetical protein
MSDIQSTSGPIVSFDIRQILTFITFLGVMSGALAYVIEVRNDVRANTLELIALRGQMESMRTQVEDVGRAKLLYCAGRRADTARSALPDIGC